MSCCYCVKDTNTKKSNQFIRLDSKTQMSPVWTHFRCPDEENGQAKVAECVHCEHKMKLTENGANSSLLWRHLYRRHNEIYSELESKISK